MQRAGARMLSIIELDRNNVSQAAIWMRRAVIGTFVIKGAGSEEVVDVLTDYARFLGEGQLPQANNLLLKLIPIYDSSFAHLGPKYVRFVGDLMESMRDTGKFNAANLDYDVLKKNTDAMDVTPTTVRSQLFYHDLYKEAVKSLPFKVNGEVTARVQQITAQYPDFAKKNHGETHLSLLGIVKWRYRPGRFSIE